ncbi:MAG: efflux RND transporter permease subunit [Planctomycetota bacterium]
MNLPRLSVKNPVAVNLLMAFVVLSGVHFWANLVREFFPNSEADQVLVTVAWPGATPDEVEKSITHRIERELDSVEDVDEIQSKVLEGVTIVTLELEPGADRSRVLADIRTEMDKVKPDLPDGAEEPEITEVRPMVPVIGVVVHGDVSETRLREITKTVRDDLLDIPDVTRVFISGMRDPEIWAEVDPERLDEYALTFEEVGRAIAGANLDLPGGQLKAAEGNVRVRTMGERSRAREIETLIVRSRPDGTSVRLRDVATVRETFEDRVEAGRFGGKPAVLITIFKTPEQDAIDIANRVKAYVKENSTRLSGAVSLSTTSDLARFIEQRLDLMTRNARLGLILVLIALACFLDLRVAFWVALGLPIAFLGTFTAMDQLGATINLISLFGLIVVLGLIVDDAIVIGENFYTKLGQGMSTARAAIEGTSEVAIPVLAAVLTTVAAFLPLMWLEGRIGTFLGVLPIVVICALGVSLIEAFIILPSHLGHVKNRDWLRPLPGVKAFFGRIRDRRDHFLETWLPDRYERALRFILHWRYVSMAAAFTISMIAFGLLAGKIIPFVLLQDTDAETLTMDLEMAAGTSEDVTLATVRDLESLALGTVEVQTVFSVIGTGFSDRGQLNPADPATVGQIVVELVPAEDREERKLRTSKELVSALREATENIPGVSKLAIRSRGGGPQGRDIEIRVRADDLDTLRGAVAHVRTLLAAFDGVYEMEDDLTEGKLEVRLELRDAARSLGLTTRGLALQIRHALHGFEAQDLQGEDEEITVRALLPLSARREIADLGRLRIATPTGDRVPLEEVATFTTERGYAALARVDGKRAITITAEVDEERGNTAEISDTLAKQVADIDARFPGTTVTFEGAKKETAESIGSLKIGFPVALLLIYSLIAVLFRSYFQPLIVMAAIPYALVGAIFGHLIMGYPFTLLSMIGSVALAGIVVNDSLILVDFINRRRRMGMPVLEAVVAGGRARLRAILLTSITTIFGIGPLMLERSFQAQFLIPMAVSIVFGLAFATLLTLVLLPTLYLAFEDLRGFFRWLATGRFSRAMPRNGGRVETESVSFSEEGGDR